MLFHLLIYLLATIGAIAILLSCGFAFAYAMLSRKLTHKMDDALADMQALLYATSHRGSGSSHCVPPMRMHLEVCRAKESLWLGETGRRADRWLNERGFQCVGDFEIEELGHERLRTFLSPDQRLIAAIRRPEGSHEPYVEFCCELEVAQQPGPQIVERAGVANPPISSVAPADPSVGKFYRGDLSHDFGLLNTMHQHAQAILREYPARSLAPNQVPEYYERAHAAEMDERMRRGGLSEKEIRETFVAQGLVASREDILNIQRQWQVAIEHHLLDFSPRGLNQHFAGRKILIVHDGSFQSYLWQRLIESLQCPGDVDSSAANQVAEALAELHTLLAKFSPREAIARFRPLLPQDARYDLVDQLQQPIAADLYVLPDAILPEAAQ